MSLRIRFIAATLAVAVVPAIAIAQAKPIDRVNLDTTCAACADFYSFANGGWSKRTQIPAAYSSFGSFTEVSDRNEALIKQVLDEDAAAVKSGKAKAGTNEWKVGTFYDACMDSTAIESAGIKPLQPTLDAINRIKTNADLAASLGTISRLGGGGVFNVGPGPDAKNSKEIIGHVGQGGLGLPEREFYFRADDRSKQMRDAYVAHIERTLVLGGESADQAKSDAQKVMALEMKLAQRSMSRVAMRDPNATYHKMMLADVQKLMPHVDLKSYIAQIGGGNVTTVNVAQPEFITGADSLLATEPVEDWKTYYRWHSINAASPTLSTPFQAEAFRWQQVMSGAKEQLPRTRRCIAATNSALSEVLSQEYIKRNFSPEAKARAVTMVENLQSALREQIKQLPWMSEATKTQALVKLDAYVRKVAYPDSWRDYAKLQVKPGAFAENLRAAREFGREINWAKLGKPVDRTEWGMPATIVNASYSPSVNGVTLPAGILQPPFFDPKADDAVNYGAIGAVIGHEIGH
ncbi:MAG: M13 family metallopeptidase, partial [Gemmatimonadota bacterium]|nr:M13 family metallopeptidase [Gemmatimonadota bacterium]